MKKFYVKGDNVMTNEKLENNEQVTRKPVKSFKEKRQFNR